MPSREYANQGKAAFLAAQRKHRTAQQGKETAMAKQNYHTSLIGRKVRLGLNIEQITEWLQANPGKPTDDIKIVPKQYSRHGGRVGAIVGAYLIQTSRGMEPIYTVESMGDLLELAPAINFDILQALPPDVEQALTDVRASHALTEDECQRIREYRLSGRTAAEWDVLTPPVQAACKALALALQRQED